MLMATPLPSPKVHSLFPLLSNILKGVRICMPEGTHFFKHQCILSILGANEPGHHELDGSRGRRQKNMMNYSTCGFQDNLLHHFTFPSFKLQLTGSRSKRRPLLDQNERALCLAQKVSGKEQEGAKEGQREISLSYPF